MANGTPIWREVVVNSIFWASGAAAIAGVIQIVKDWINFHRHMSEITPLITQFHQDRLDNERRFAVLEEGQRRLVTSVSDLTEAIKEERRERLDAAR